MIVPLLLSALVDQARIRARRGRLHELENRLGLRRPKPPLGIAGRMKWVLETYGPEVWALTHMVLHRHMVRFPWATQGDSSTYHSDIESRAHPWLSHLPPQAAKRLVPWIVTSVRDLHREGAPDVEAMVMRGRPDLALIEGGWERARRGLVRGVHDQADHADFQPLLPMIEEDLRGSPRLEPWRSPLNIANTAEAWALDRWRFLTGRDWDQEYTRFIRLLDWIDQTSPDLERYSLLEALDAADAWHVGLRGHMGYREPATGGVVIARWPDGATIVRLVTKRDFASEGTSMGHCVGGELDDEGIAPGDSDYWRGSRDGRGACFSYRDTEGVPQATVFVSLPDVRIQEVQGPDDEDINDEIARERLTAWLHTSLGHLDDLRLWVPPGLNSAREIQDRRDRWHQVIQPLDLQLLNLQDDIAGTDIVSDRLAEVERELYQRIAQDAARVAKFLILNLAEIPATPWDQRMRTRGDDVVVQFPLGYGAARVIEGEMTQGAFVCDEGLVRDEELGVLELVIPEEGRTFWRLVAWRVTRHQRGGRATLSAASRDEIEDLVERGVPHFQHAYISSATGDPWRSLVVETIGASADNPVDALIHGGWLIIFEHWTRELEAMLNEAIFLERLAEVEGRDPFSHHEMMNLRRWTSPVAGTGHRIMFLPTTAFLDIMGLQHDRAGNLVHVEGSPPYLGHLAMGDTESP